MACLHFFRTVTKMNFGENDPNAGTPPPILLFNAYGPFVFNNLPVIVKQFTFSFPDDVDYVEVTVAGSKTVQTTAAKTVDNRIFGENLAPIGQTGQQGGYNTVGPFSGRSTNVLGNVTTTPGSNQAIQTNSTVWLPSMFKLSATLVVQHTPKTLRSRFNLPAYINGNPNQSDFI